MPRTMWDTPMALMAFAAALLGIVASVLLILTFGTELSFKGPYPYGAGYEVATAVVNLLTAGLVLHLTRLASPSRRARVCAFVLVVLLAVAAILSVLLVAQAITYTASVVATVVVLSAAGIWMIWVNRRFRQEGIFPTFVSTFGWLIGLCLVIGLPVAALGLALPEITLAQLLVLGFGVFLAGGAWVVWSVWWIFVGVGLLRGVRAGQGSARQRSARRGSDASPSTMTGAAPASGRGTKPSPNAATETDAPVKLRGRRKA